MTAVTAAAKPVEVETRASRGTVAYVLRKAGAKRVASYALAHQVMPGLERKGEEPHEESGEVNPFLLHLRV